jgi:imidazolonepropionase-like amidohydrolase
MKSALSSLVLALSGLSAATAAVSPDPPPPAPTGPTTLLVSHLLDGTGQEAHDLTIVLRNGRIERIDAGIRAPVTGTVIDLRGFTVMPGFIDTHVHLDSHWDAQGRIATETESAADAATGIANAAWASLMGGFTTVQSVGDPSERPLRDAIRDRGFARPSRTHIARLDRRGCQYAG